ncbi:MAG: inosine/xanthosine triphosphatase [Candidatus Acidiferrales bacterium]
MTRKIVIAVGTRRRPKLEAVSEALAMIGAQIDASAEFEITGVDVPSGVRHTPLSRGDTMAGARHRAEMLREVAREKKEAWKYFVGLEGGLDVFEESGKRLVMLESWAYVLDASGRGAFGRSGGVMVPETLAKTVVDDGVELAEAVDAFAGGRGIRDAQGAWGVLTRDLITRQEAFRVAVIAAFAPFFQAGAYREAESKTSGH